MTNRKATIRFFIGQLHTHNNTTTFDISQTMTIINKCYKAESEVARNEKQNDSKNI